MSATGNSFAPSAGHPVFDVLIVGSGFAGLCMAIKLKQAGQHNFALLERAAGVGGAWRANSYPGAACDVPSHLYSFSFEPNPNWSRKYPTQPELHAYLERVAGKYGLMPHLRPNDTLLGADYDEATQLWHVRTSQGALLARAVVSASGCLAEPKLPEIPGIENFRGQTFHSARWDHDYDLTGQRVAVIGTGASSIQFVPQIAPQVGRLDVYQRTPNWIIPRRDRAYTQVEKKLFRLAPFFRYLHRAWIYWTHETRVLGIVLRPSLMKIFQKVAENHIRSQVQDPGLRAKVTPHYTIGCKRILISNDWYPALQRSNVDLVTDGIREIRENAVVTADGAVREVDCIIFGTGFYATENPIAQVIHGRGGESLAHAWRNGEEAYLGTLVQRFPNLFFILGPNTALGHSSMVFMIETQVTYIMRLLRHLKQQSAHTLEVRAEVQEGYNRRLQERLAGSVWSTGCKSWYHHKNGKITALWPGFTFSFWLRSRAFRAGDYTLTGQTAMERLGRPA